MKVDNFAIEFKYGEKTIVLVKNDIVFPKTDLVVGDVHSTFEFNSQMQPFLGKGFKVIAIKAVSFSNLPLANNIYVVKLEAETEDDNWWPLSMMNWNKFKSVNVLKELDEDYFNENI